MCVAILCIFVLILVGIGLCDRNEYERQYHANDRHEQRKKDGTCPCLVCYWENRLNKTQPPSQ